MAADVKAERVLWVLHGVNLDMLGERDPEHYGRLTLAELEALVAEAAEARGFAARFFQTNHEGELIDRIHAIAREGGPVLINPGAWTHYSYALRDALEIVRAPVAEVHLSDLASREEWRRTSVLADLASVRVSGKGVDGYLEAIGLLADLLDEGGSE